MRVRARARVCVRVVRAVCVCVVHAGAVLQWMAEAPDGLSGWLSGWLSGELSSMLSGGLSSRLSAAAAGSNAAGEREGASPAARPASCAERGACEAVVGRSGGGAPAEPARGVGRVVAASAILPHAFRRAHANVQRSRVPLGAVGCVVCAAFERAGGAHRREEEGPDTVPSSKLPRIVPRIVPDIVPLGDKVSRWPTACGREAASARVSQGRAGARHARITHSGTYQGDVALPRSRWIAATRAFACFPARGSHKKVSRARAPRRHCSRGIRSAPSTERPHSNLDSRWIRTCERRTGRAGLLRYSRRRTRNEIRTRTHGGRCSSTAFCQLFRDWLSHLCYPLPYPSSFWTRTRIRVRVRTRTRNAVHACDLTLPDAFVRSMRFNPTVTYIVKQQGAQIIRSQSAPTTLWHYAPRLTAPLFETG